MGVSHLAAKVCTRYLVTSCVLSGIQAITSLIVVSLWAVVHREIVEAEPNCIIQVITYLFHVVFAPYIVLAPY